MLKSKNIREGRMMMTSLALGLATAMPVAAEDFMFEEVVVTATRRATTLEDLPLSVSALSSAQLRELGISKASDLEQMTPGLNIQAGAFSVSSPQISIRGVGNNFFNGNAVATVGVYLDQIYLNSAIGHGVHLFDLERVEVLRGPQGTLYGGNATGGAINLISKKPEVGKETSGNLNIDVGDYGEAKLEGGVSFPVSDTVAVRLSALSSSLDGYRENTFLNKDVGAYDSSAFRAQLTWEPSDELQVSLRAHTAEVDADGPQYEMRGRNVPGATADNVYNAFGSNFQPEFRCDDASILVNNCASWGGYQDGVSSPGFHEGSGDVVGKDNVKVSGGDATIEWQLGELTLTSVTGWVNTTRFTKEDLDGTPLDSYREIWDTEAEQFSQEIRLSGNTDKLDWIVGGFYLNEDSEEYKDFVFGEVWGFENGELTYWEMETENFALFTDLKYQINEDFALSGGLRFSDESKEVGTFIRHLDARLGSLDKNLEYGWGQASQLLNGDPAEDASGQGESWTSTTGRISLDWNMSEDTLVYASYSKGFRSGNINTAEGGGATLNFVAPEDVLATELGLKTAVFGSRGKLNIAAFFNDYTDLQVSSVLGNSIVLLNAGEAETYGLEMELKFQATDALYTQFSMAFLETEITQADYDATLEGNELEQSPNLTFNALAVYTWQVGEANVRAQLSYSYKDDHQMDVFNGFSAEQEGYGLLGSRVSYETGPYSLSAWLKNATDEEYYTNVFGSRFLGAETFSTGAPRTFGVSFSYSYE